MLKTTYSPPIDSTGIPPGWSYNPSEWRERCPLVAGASMGLLLALYLGTYQLRLIPSIWDPFFSSASSEAVLNSPIAKALPIPDAFLGAFAYLLDAVSGSLGDTKRWKTSPWHVLFFGFVVGPVGVTSLFLVIAQPVLIHAWCSLCLVSAVISTLLIGPAMDEVLASLQYLQRVKQNERSVWNAFCGDKQISSTVI